jgi:drug/metabolite transporter (DMT)-like permease
MSVSVQSKKWSAIQWLVLATVFWGTSFPTLKSILTAQHNLLPEASTWFCSSVTLCARFGLAALILGVWLNKRLAGCTWLEWWEGLGLGLFGGVGLLFQMDGLAYTSASSSAFLTQFYCVTIPVFVALQKRRLPNLRIMASCIIVLAGVGILAQLDWHTMHVGRGEAETLLGSILFMGEILWLERPMFKKNAVGPVTFIMFAVMGLSCLPTGLVTTRHASDWIVALSAPHILFFIAWLVLFCTLAAYLLMNRWQPEVSATEAGLIYCSEPLFASCFALVLPGWFSALGGLNYANESLTMRLVIGGSLITAANLLIQYPSPSQKPIPNPER